MIGEPSKASLYLGTVSHLKPSQVGYRIWRKLGGKTRLKPGYVPRPDAAKADVGRIPVLPELDFDAAFLGRFDVSAIMLDRVSLLHHEEPIDWTRSWHDDLATPLWRFNLHYCEYLLPLAKAFVDSGDVRYLEKGQQIIGSWIDSCPESKGGPAWDPYTISMRVVNWLAFLGEANRRQGLAEGFVRKVNESLAEQYVALANHLEKDLLANHLFENVKATVILSEYFKDGPTSDIASKLLERQTSEQILGDGLHCELSPMYHKVILEDLLRALSYASGNDRYDLGFYRKVLQRMLNVVFSLEGDGNRTPLFNDSGDNVSKSPSGLLACAEKCFGLVPEQSDRFPEGGMYVLRSNVEGRALKVVVKGGALPPKYAMGHMHNDCASLEAFLDGVPVVVNCGTFAYQDPRRSWFRGNSAHNVASVRSTEQSQCWGRHRVARHCETAVQLFREDRIVLKTADYKGNEVVRTICLEGDSLTIRDECKDERAPLASYVHVRPPVRCPNPDDFVASQADYAEDFGLLDKVTQLACFGTGKVAVRIRFGQPVEVSRVPQRNRK